MSCLSYRESVCLSVCHTLRPYQNGAIYDHEIFTVGSLKDPSFGIRKALSKTSDPDLGR